MIPLDRFAHTPAAAALGWAIVHSIWQGAIVALALAAFLGVVRPARARYAAACAALLLLAAAFAITLLRVWPEPSMYRIAARAPGSYVLLAGAARPASPGESGTARYLPWLAPFWAAGVLLFYLRYAASWLAARRLRVTGVCAAPEPWPGRLAILRARIRLLRPAVLLESCLAEAPVVIGYLRPVILMPVGLLAGLPMAQVEAILLHELAHIRRNDYLVNLLQTVVESLLFYHPAAWWISGVIRAEREHCCDDLVVATHGNAHEYATALAALEQNRWAAREAAMAATGGNLMKRIRRLLNQPEGTRVALAPVFSAALLTLIAAGAMFAWQSRPAPVGGTASEATASPYLKWLQQDVAYIISDEERSAFRQLQTDEEREHFIEQFWLRRDPTPNTVENEAKEEHYRRIAYANQRFASPTVAGWKTDRGRIYILYGPPNEIEDHPAGSYQRPPEAGGGMVNTYPFVMWQYEIGARFEFVDQSGTGEFRLTLDPHEKEVVPYAAGQSGGRVFGNAATVEVTPDRHMLVSIPIEFHAAQYAITGSTTGNGYQVGFDRVVTLCRDTPAALGCLVRPVFQPQTEQPLNPGSYVLQVTVRDRGGAAGKTYTVNFDVQ